MHPETLSRNESWGGLQPGSLVTLERPSARYRQAERPRQSNGTSMVRASFLSYELSAMVTGG